MIENAWPLSPLLWSALLVGLTLCGLFALCSRERQTRRQRQYVRRHMTRSKD